MLSTSLSHLRRRRALPLVAGLVIAAAAPALAQTAQELTVIGRYGPDADARSLSAVVSYADLDLTTDAGRAALRDRVRLSAQDLCRRLGETDTTGSPLVPSCQQGAIDSAREQERIAFAAATPRAYAVAPPAAEPYVAPMEPSASAAPAAESYGQAASVTVSTVTNGPVPDTVENRQRYGGPMSNGGRRTQPAGN